MLVWPEALANHTYDTEGNYTALVMAHTQFSHDNDTVRLRRVLGIMFLYQRENDYNDICLKFVSLKFSQA